MELYKTKDIYEASAISAKSVKLVRLEKENNFYWFVFENPAICNQVSADYWNNELMVLAKDYADAIRSLKDRLFAKQ